MSDNVCYITLRIMSAILMIVGGALTGVVPGIIIASTIGVNPSVGAFWGALTGAIAGTTMMLRDLISEVAE